MEAYNKKTEEVLSLLATDSQNGLSASEVLARTEKCQNRKVRREQAEGEEKEINARSLFRAI